MVLFPYMKRKNKQGEAYKRLLLPPLPLTHEVPITSFSLEDLSEWKSCFEVTKSKNYIILFCFSTSHESISFKEAIQDQRWKNAMNKEIKVIRKNDT